MPLRATAHITLSTRHCVVTLMAMASRIGKKGSIFYIHRKYSSKARRIMRGVTVFVVRWNGIQFRNSRPCMHCCAMLQSLGVKIAAYSSDDGSIIYEKANQISSKHISFARKVYPDS